MCGSGTPLDGRPSVSSAGFLLFLRLEARKQRPPTVTARMLARATRKVSDGSLRPSSTPFSRISTWWYDAAPFGDQTVCLSLPYASG